MLIEATLTKFTESLSLTHTLSHTLTLREEVKLLGEIEGFQWEREGDEKIVCICVKITNILYIHVRNYQIYILKIVSWLYIILLKIIIYSQ